MNLTIRIQLSVMMFIQFFIWGAWYVTGPNYLGQIGFQGGDFGWMYSVGPIAGMISPFFVGMVADRFFPVQRVLGAMHLLGGALMLGAITLMKGDSPSPKLINIAFFAHMLAYFPTLALTNTLAMRNMTSSEKEFPLIRVFGTIGWIAANFVLSWAGWSTKIDMFYLCAISAFALGIFSFTLPNTPPNREKAVSIREILGLDAWVLLKNRSYLIFIFCSTLICIPLAFYYQLASRVVELSDFNSIQLLQQITNVLKFGDVIAATMSFGQISEILFMIAMPLCFRRLGVKWMLAVGMLAWVARYALFAIGTPEEIRWMIFLGVLLHGICYDFFFVTGQIYTDQIAPSNIRGQAQGMLVLFTLGLGMLIGAQIAGALEVRYSPRSAEFAEKNLTLGTKISTVETQLKESVSPQKEAIATLLTELNDEKSALRKEELRAMNWKAIWGIPALFAGAVMALFIFLFKDNRTKPKAA